MTGVLAIVQARMTSTRLPGKVLADVGGEPMLMLLLRRLQRAKTVGQIVIATSSDPSDDEVENLARKSGSKTYRGSLDDVLGRFVGAAGDYRGALARITADCPLIDPTLLDAVVELFDETPNCAYASNIEPRTYPDGLDVEVFGREALDLAAELAIDPDDREHVTTIMRGDPIRFPSAALTSAERLGDLRWTVDDETDLDFLRQVIARLGTRRYTADMEEILGAIRMEPSLANYQGRRG
jgi:spore coat polysaccharide biosynthesis protein SpsF (cytidylyltransferase family)